jgi:pSer/pThr/pTyr-binding forkhead associated (FHA) protein
VSRHHALISRCEDRVVIEDLDSHNGIFVDSRRVSRCDLQPGNTVAIGNFRLHFRRDPAGKAIAGSARPAPSAAECADK